MALVSLASHGEGLDLRELRFEGRNPCVWVNFHLKICFSAAVAVEGTGSLLQSTINLVQDAEQKR